jgi:5-methyltetrahydropteroyltriglutamate--homocysteine methyltransferase
MCFGYAATVKHKPSGYSFLPELDACAAAQISIEAAQPKLDLAILERLPSKQVMVGVISMGDPQVESAETVAARIRAALEHLPPERVVVAPDCGMKYLSREVALGKLRAMVRGAQIVREELRARGA